MTQLSRPFQIVLVAFALLVLVWFVALRGHSPSTSSSGSSSSSASAPASSSNAPASASSSSASTPKTGSSESSATPNAAAEAKAAAAPTHVYHGSAPGLEGLSRAINHAHGAVAQSQREAKRVENEEPGSTGNKGSSSDSSASASHGSSASAAAGASTSAATRAAHAQGSGSAAKSGVPPMQQAVEDELKQNKTVLILFWNPRGSDDRAVHSELPAVQHALGSKLAVHNSLAAQVGAYGTITHAVQVTGTPTIVIVNPQGHASTLTGLNDAYSIEQAVIESHRS